MVETLFNDDDLTKFLDQFDDVQELDNPAIDDNLNDLFPSIWTQEEQHSSKLDHSVSDFSLQEALVTEAGTNVNKLRMSTYTQPRLVNPVSVLNKNTGFGFSVDLAKTMLRNVTVKERTRTKQRRQSTVNHTSSSHQLVSASWTWTDSLDETHNHAMERKRKSRKFNLSSSSVMDQNPKKNPNSELCEQRTERRCTHCDITMTPQWRLGPMGPKTLCNACGVRYKSGRLFPEYCPAASPTFSPSRHSNSHRKVLEMRRNDGKDTPSMDTVKGKAVDCEENHLVPVSVKLIADDICWG